MTDYIWRQIEEAFYEWNRDHIVFARQDNAKELFVVISERYEGNGIHD